MGSMTESMVEEAALSWLEALGYNVQFGPDMVPGELFSERGSYQDVILERRLTDAIARLNPQLPPEAQEEALRKVKRPESPSLTSNNRTFHQMLVEGVNVEYRTSDGSIAGDQVRLVDFDNPDNNDWLVVNQFTVVEGEHERRPDIVLFVNGIPLAVIELKNPADENATIWSAFNQLQTYKKQISSLFTFNEILVISDGLQARLGSLTANKEWFLPWRTIEGEEVASAAVPQLEVLVKGVFEKNRFLELLRYCIVFEDDVELAKKIAGYHQFHAAREAIDASILASRPDGDKRCGVVWHTQGSGKSLTMAFYAGRIILHHAMENPTLVVITDRNDLDDQLFGTFSSCHELLRQKPVQAESRADLRKLLSVASGGVIFTTIQKFFPEESGDKHPQLSDRRNILVIADEAHRSQYDFIDGFARHMRDALPNASFIGFTGTPIELTDKNTRAVFGDYISIYDIQRAVEDGATVPIYYESRMVKLDLDQSEQSLLDEEFDLVTEEVEEYRREKLKTKWAALEAVVGEDKRVAMIAADLVDHFDKRLEAMDGKAMVVCMSRRICVDLYDEIVKLRPKWDTDDDSTGVIKVVMTGSASDALEWQRHIRNKPRREALRQRFRDPADPFKVVIVRDMWLTGFDAPCLHTMYVDKLMRGHGLMQSIARVNRVFKDKPGGLVVDYLGLANQLREATIQYTESGGEGRATIDKDEAVAVMLEKYEVCLGLFHGFDWSVWVSGSPEDRLHLLPAAQEHILAQEEGKERLLAVVTQLSQAFALAVPRKEALEIRDDLAFFQAVRSAIAKSSGAERPEEDLDHAIKQLVSKAVAPDEVIDIFAAAGLKRPDISILSDEFLDEVRDLPQRNLAVELLQKLLNDEIRTRKKRNIVQARSFAEMLEKSIRAYQNRSIETAALIEELIKLAKEMREADRRGEDLGLSEEELAFYDALETNDSAVAVLGDETLRKIAKEIVQTVRNNVTIDWTVRENVRARMRVMVKRVLRKYGYPPDKQEAATRTVLEQAELLCSDLST
ncbi:MAG: type I restriction endonuclease subunit R [Actinobacteria bacterium]|nr:type I restriction endonuclease subunit R [Actinomycetota bacterium]MCG2819132.1 type I restriction endonuclease subunit R [Actinomycetes bacterium]MBU4218739.1 type I restriction endonuclease subunit R [Actinomycetota bacterium]MBU4359468.1 type I restriction endonuclease subunit R [Actinomycetota bacterium]MBU4391339.1 type I restriction endonuclease subunit R [Actinomycetota bacterium]